MSSITIRTDRLSKEYTIGVRGIGRENFREMLISTTSRFFQRAMHPGQSPVQKERFWALREVSFEVKEGEIVGIIGRNGAGKSTLLKILSRITEPTEGYAELRGRVTSLLEVGTGFHTELTGRENVYLSGTILGMKKREIDQKFQEIVSFAEIEKFIDTPVKRYSSGMYFRLAFSVAAHLEPEILLVDEVLAVGDTVFQKKCLGKMDDVAKRGRTVLFVTHQMNQIRRLCQRCIWLDSGQLRKIGETVEVVNAYEISMASQPFREGIRESEDDHAAAKFLKWEILEPRSKQPNMLETIGPVTISFVLKVNKPIHNGNHHITLINSVGQILWGTAASKLSLGRDVYELIYKLPGLPLRPGSYFWRVSLYDDQGLLDTWECVPELIVATEPMAHWLDEWAGVLNFPCKFSIEHYKK